MRVYSCVCMCMCVQARAYSCVCACECMGAVVWLCGLKCSLAYLLCLWSLTSLIFQLGTLQILSVSETSLIFWIVMKTSLKIPNKLRGRKCFAPYLSSSLICQDAILNFPTYSLHSFRIWLIQIIKYIILSIIVLIDYHFPQYTSSWLKNIS